MPGTPLNDYEIGIHVLTFPFYTKLDAGKELFPCFITLLIELADSFLSLLK